MYIRILTAILVSGCVAGAQSVDPERRIAAWDSSANLEINAATGSQPEWQPANSAAALPREESFASTVWQQRALPRPATSILPPLSHFGFVTRQSGSGAEATRPAESPVHPPSQSGELYQWWDHSLNPEPPLTSPLNRAPGLSTFAGYSSFGRVSSLYSFHLFFPQPSPDKVRESRKASQQFRKPPALPLFGPDNLFSPETPDNPQPRWLISIEKE
jgi:hypothetical protein